MAKRKPKSKRPQPQHKKQKKSQHDKQKRLHCKNLNRKKTSQAKVPLTGPLHDAVAQLQACLDGPDPKTWHPASTQKQRVFAVIRRSACT